MGVHRCNWSGRDIFRPLCGAENSSSTPPKSDLRTPHGDDYTFSILVRCTSVRIAPRRAEGLRQTDPFDREVVLFFKSVPSFFVAQCPRRCAEKMASTWKLFIQVAVPGRGTCAANVALSGALRFVSGECIVDAVVMGLYNMKPQLRASASEL